MIAGRDRELILHILKLGHQIERTWATSSTDARARDYKLLRRLISSCEFTSAPEIRRLAKWCEHLSDDMDLRHLYGILVPFERLAHRSVQDDEFLVTTEDRPKPALQARTPSSTTGLAVEAGKIDHLSEKLELVGVLNDIRSAFNVGAIFRTAECLVLQELVLCGYSPDPDNEKTAKTAMGTEQNVSWRRSDRLETACRELKQGGYAVVALETSSTAPALFDFPFPKKTALLVGNERFGIEAVQLKAVDHVLRIPVRGQKNSLNVGIAFSIAAYEYYRQFCADQLASRDEDGFKKDPSPQA